MLLVGFLQPFESPVLLPRGDEQPGDLGRTDGQVGLPGREAPGHLFESGLGALPAARPLQPAREISQILGGEHFLVLAARLVQPAQDDRMLDELDPHRKEVGTPAQDLLDLGLPGRVPPHDTELGRIGCLDHEREGEGGEPRDQNGRRGTGGPTHRPGSSAHPAQRCSRAPDTEIRRQQDREMLERYPAAMAASTCRRRSPRSRRTACAGSWDRGGAPARLPAGRPGGW